MKQQMINEIVNEYKMKGSDAFSILYNQNNTLVMEHPKYPEYLLKLSDKDFKSSQLQSEILASIALENNNISRIHHTQIYNNQGKTKTMELIDKLPGSPRREYSETDISNVILATKELQDSLNQSEKKHHKDFPSIGVLFSNIIRQTSNSTLKSIADQIQNDVAYEHFLDAENQTVIVADMVYENILIDKDVIYFIDLDPLVLGPKRLQCAILLTSNLLLQTNLFNCLSMELIRRYMRLWGFETITREDLIALTIFPLLILSMRQVDIDSLPENDDSIYYKLKTILLFIMAELDQ